MINMTRISILDARYVYGRDVVDIASREPVQVTTADNVDMWLCKDSNNHYQLLENGSFDILRDDGSYRPYVGANGLMDSQPLGF